MEKMTHKKVAWLTVPDPAGGGVIVPEDGEAMYVVSATYGDYEIPWVVHYAENGDEIRRFNARNVEMIQWDRGE